MSSRRLLTGAAGLAAALPGAVATTLRAPRTVRDHPRAVEVRQLRRAGWSVERVAVSVDPPRAAVRLALDGQVREIADNDLAFAAYAAALRSRLPTGSPLGGAT